MSVSLMAVRDGIIGIPMSNKKNQVSVSEKMINPRTEEVIIPINEEETTPFVRPNPWAPSPKCTITS